MIGAKDKAASRWRGGSTTSGPSGVGPGLVDFGNRATLISYGYAAYIREGQMALAVTGAGLGRTGTLSPKLALERLRLSRCYHVPVRESLAASIPFGGCDALRPVLWSEEAFTAVGGDRKGRPEPATQV